MPKDSDQTQPFVERRSFVRVQDAVGLQIRQLHEIPAAGEASAETSVEGGSRSLNKYDIAGYGQVKRNFPAVATYIADLEERIRQLLLDTDHPQALPTHKVSLSAGGIAFADEMLLHPGQLVGITLTLFPSQARVGCDARIVSAGDAPEIANGDNHTYRTEFLRVTDADRDVLNQHVAGLINSLPQHD